jgi:hypothetical protein
VDEEDPYLSLQEGRNRAEVKINDGESSDSEEKWGRRGGGGRKRENEWMNAFALPFLASRRH